MTQKQLEELRQAIEACLAVPSMELCSDVYDGKWSCELDNGHWGKHKSGGLQWLRKDERRPSPVAKFHKVASPVAVLDLLAENERMRELLRDASPYIKGYETRPATDAADEIEDFLEGR